MSLYGTMRTAVSGISAQSTRLGTVADNIANSGTSGYKRASTEFSSMVMPNTGTGYTSGGVSSSVRYAISSEGVLSYTTSATDLAISGNGFFVVSDKNGAPSLTRAGAFVPDSNGYLVNAAGYRLMGYDYANGVPAPTANGYAGLVPVSLRQDELMSAPSTYARFDLNVPAEAQTNGTAVSGTPPSENGPYTAYSYRTSFAHGGPLGGLAGDVYYTKVADNTWEVTVFARDQSSPAGFPYPLPTPGLTATTTLTMDPTTGAITGGNPLVTLYPGGEPLGIDLSGVTQNAAPAGAPGYRPHMNLASNTPAVAPGDQRPSDNDPASIFHIRQQMSGYTGLGAPVNIDAYYTKVGPDTWEASFFDSALAGPLGFPYGTAGDPPLATTTLEFDPVTGALVSGSPASIPLGGGDTFVIDYTDMVSLDDSHPDWDDELGSIAVNLNLSPFTPVLEPYIAGLTPANNAPNSAFTNKTSFVAYDNLGGEVLLDVYLTKGPDNHWEVTVFNRADASAHGSFPYGAPGSAPLATGLVEFDANSGQLIDGGLLTVPVPNGAELTLDMTSMTRLAAPFTVHDMSANGTSPATASDYTISDDGILYADYGENGLVPLYRLALATVQSPDQMSVHSGNIFRPSADSGDVRLGFAGAGGYGEVVSGALENSNVDLAEELTSMIEAQRSYTANSKVFQTGSELMDILANLKR